MGTKTALLAFTDGRHPPRPGSRAKLATKTVPFRHQGHSSLQATK
jgi:hypothetical protein